MSAWLPLPTLSSAWSDSQTAPSRSGPFLRSFRRMVSGTWWLHVDWRTECLSLFKCDLSPRIEVDLVANKHAADLLIDGSECECAVLVHFSIPVGHVIETLSVSDIINDNNAVGVSIVTVGDGPETLLASSVPLCQGKGTSTSFAFSPSQLTILFFLVGAGVRSQLRLC